MLYSGLRLDFLNDFSLSFREVVSHLPNKNRAHLVCLYISLAFALEGERNTKDNGMCFQHEILVQETFIADWGEKDVN